MHADYRIGIDLGTNSLGWCVFDLDRKGRPRGVRRLGVRIFSDGRDPQSGTSLAADRRLAREQRRRRDRYLDRRGDLMKALVRHGLMPADNSERKKLETLDPYELRARGLDQQLTLHELGRAFFHLNQRRGFKSNRKTDRPADPEKLKEAENMNGAANKLAGAIEESGCRTLGEYLFKTAREGRSVRGSKDGSVQPHLSVRARPHTVKGRNAYDFYPTRAMYEQEFDALWAAQSQHHPDLSEAARDEIKDIVFYQRPLKPVDPGPCTLEPADKRAPLALPIVQQFRILQELANLRLENPVEQKTHRLTLAERDKLFEELRRRKDLSFDSIRKKHLRLGSEWKINLEEARRDKLKGDFVSKQLSDDKCFGTRWFDLPEERQTAIVQILFEEPSEDIVVTKATKEWGLTEAQARAAAKVSLPDGYGRLGLNALRKIVPIMREQVDERGGPLHYSEAAERAGYRHSDFRTGEIWDALPYYGQVLSRYVAPVKAPGAPPEEREFGRIANPTVHIGLNETRKLVNKLIEIYGHPAEVVVELARDLKLNKEQKDDIKKEQAANRRKNEERRQKLEEIGQMHRTDGILRLRLWEELGGNPADRRCVYTGEQISINRLFSDEVEIEHILPFQDTLDDSPANLTVSLRRANRDKGKRTPYGAFGHTPQWDGIVKRASAMPPNKRWRFQPDAMDLVRDRVKRDLARLRGELPADVLDDIERTGGFLARQLIDTAYLARVARQYLWSVCNPNKVRVVPGRLTEFLRRKWGLNRLLYGNRPAPDDEEGAGGFVAKRRDDHRHHAIDAFVVGLTELPILQKVSTAAAQARDRLIEDMPEPWDGFRDDLRERLDRVVVSFRPEHGAQGKLHEETAYGIVNENTLVYRKPLAALNDNEIGRIRDPKLRGEVMAAVAGFVFDSASLDTAKEAHERARKLKDKDAVARAKSEIAKLKNAKKETKKSGAKDLRVALADFAAKRGIRHVRLLKTESAYVPIGHADGHPYKALSTGDNHRVEIYEMPDGEWRAEVISVFDSNRERLGRFSPHWRHDAPRARQVAALFKNDLVRLGVNGQDRTMRVVSIWEKYLQLALHNETNLAERYRTGEFKWTFANYEKLKELRVRKVTVDVLGRVHDPGPPK